MSRFEELLLTKKTRDLYLAPEKTMFSEFTLGRDELAIKTNQIHTLAGAGKHRHPMTLYDPNLVVALNEKKYFSYSVGAHYLNQKTTLIDDLNNGRQTNLTVTSRYGLSGEHHRVSILVCSMLIESEDTLSAFIMCGRAMLLPRFLYDISSIECAIHDIALSVGATSVKLGLFIQQMIYNAEPEEVAKYGMSFSEIPSTEEIAALVIEEQKARNLDYRQTFIVETPLSVEQQEYLSTVKTRWLHGVQ